MKDRGALSIVAEGLTVEGHSVLLEVMVRKRAGGWLTITYVLEGFRDFVGSSE